LLIKAIKDACAAYRFREFTQNYTVFASTASIALPSNFRELEEHPQLKKTVFLPLIHR
jgi:hypothetical protein